MMLFAKEGWAFGDTAAGALPFVKKPERSGTHGHDPNIPDLHATFVSWGAGIKPGATLGEINNVDVAPTIAKILGLDMPGVDGKPLTEILAK
jgi:predicted AlkP superfamily pyrophosphatase or phosphodiesterase